MLILTKECIIIDFCKFSNFKCVELAPRNVNKFLGITKNSLLISYNQSKIKSPGLVLGKNYVLKVDIDKRFVNEKYITFYSSAELVKGLFDTKFDYITKYNRIKYALNTKNIRLDIFLAFNKTGLSSANMFKQSIRLKNRNLISTLKKVFAFFPELKTFGAIYFVEDKRLFTHLIVTAYSNIDEFLKNKFFKNENIKITYEELYEKNIMLDNYEQYAKIAQKLWHIKTSKNLNFIKYLWYAYRRYVNIRNLRNSKLRSIAQEFYQNNMFTLQLNKKIAYKDSEGKELLDIIPSSTNLEKEMEKKLLLEKIEEILKEKYNITIADVIRDIEEGKEISMEIIKTLREKLSGKSPIKN